MEKYPTRENSQNTLVHVHHGVIQALDAIDGGVVVQPNEDVIPQASSHPQQLCMPSVEQVKGSVNVDNPLGIPKGPPPVACGIGGGGVVGGALHRLRKGRN